MLRDSELDVRNDCAMLKGYAELLWRGVVLSIGLMIWGAHEGQAAIFVELCSGYPSTVVDGSQKLSIEQGGYVSSIFMYHNLLPIVPFRTVTLGGVSVPPWL